MALQDPYNHLQKAPDVPYSALCSLVLSYIPCVDKYEYCDGWFVAANRPKDQDQKDQESACSWLYFSHLLCLARG